jgi:hypothetical protein
MGPPSCALFERQLQHQLPASTHIVGSWHSCWWCIGAPWLQLHCTDRLLDASIWLLTTANLWGGIMVVVTCRPLTAKPIAWGFGPYALAGIGNGTPLNPWLQRTLCSSTLGLKFRFVMIRDHVSNQFPYATALVLTIASFTSSSFQPLPPVCCLSCVHQTVCHIGQRSWRCTELY